MQVATLADSLVSPDLYANAVQLFSMARTAGVMASTYGNDWAKFPPPWNGSAIDIMTKKYRAVATALGREEHRTRDLSAISPETAAVFAFSLVGNLDADLRWVGGSAMQTYLERGLPGAPAPSSGRGTVVVLVTLGLVGAAVAGVMLARSEAVTGLSRRPSHARR